MTKESCDENLVVEFLEKCIERGLHIERSYPTRYQYLLKMRAARCTPSMARDSIIWLTGQGLLLPLGLNDFYFWISYNIGGLQVERVVAYVLLVGGSITSFASVVPFWLTGFCYGRFENLAFISGPGVPDIKAVEKKVSGMSTNIKTDKRAVLPADSENLEAGTGTRRRKHSHFKRFDLYEMALLCYLFGCLQTYFTTWMFVKISELGRMTEESSYQLDLEGILRKATGPLVVFWGISFVLARMSDSQSIDRML